MGTPRLYATATRLRDGQVLITGGYHGNNIVSSNAGFTERDFSMWHRL